MSKALVVLSGGQDSTTCLFWAKMVYSDGIHAITFDYDQRHSIEIDCAQTVAKRCGVLSHEIIYIGANVLRSSSPLTEPGVPLETYTDYKTMDKIIGDRVELTFVPMRNDLFLTIAANRAINLGVHDIVTGVCQQDNANYPDCRQSFITAKERAINEALGVRNFSIVTPLMNMSKSNSIKLAMTMPGCMDALAYSHTSYDGKYPPTGKDHASTLRAQGFLEAGVADPLVLRAWREGLMALPETDNYAGIDPLGRDEHSTTKLARQAGDD